MEIWMPQISTSSDTKRVIEMYTQNSSAAIIAIINIIPFGFVYALCVCEYCFGSSAQQNKGEGHTNKML